MVVAEECPTVGAPVSLWVCQRPVARLSCSSSSEGFSFRCSPVHGFSLSRVMFLVCSLHQAPGPKDFRLLSFFSKGFVVLRMTFRSVNHVELIGKV